LLIDPGSGGGRCCGSGGGVVIGFIKSGVYCVGVEDLVGFVRPFKRIRNMTPEPSKVKKPISIKATATSATKATFSASLPLNGIPSI